MMDLHIIWFRHDLRVHDHAALNAAANSGARVLPLYIFDPEDWAQPERSARQFEMVVDAVKDLREHLKTRGADLCIRTGSPIRILADLHRQHGIGALHMHHETSKNFALLRDRRIAQWCRQAGVSLRMQDQDGVAAKDHPSLAKCAAEHFSVPCKIAPEKISAATIPSEEFPLAADLSLSSDPCPERVDARRSAGIAALKLFLAGDARDYDGQPRTPEGMAVSSRLSNHLNLGTLSAREVWHYVKRARQSLREDGDTTFVHALDHFLDRLHLRRSLLQQAETDTTLEGRSFDTPANLSQTDSLLMEALMRGRTGFPIIDAAIRCAQQTGWLPYHMRALILGFATRLLWLEPEDVARNLARLMTDYSPALHAMNVQRILSGEPTCRHIVKASQKLSASGDFLRAWLPELASLDTSHLHAPWDAPKASLKQANVILGQTYPMPVVDHVAAASASNATHAVRREQPRLPLQGGTRPPNAVTPRRPRKITPPEQLSFDLGPVAAA